MNSDDPSRILDEYYRGGLLASPPSERLREACRRYVSRYELHEELAASTEACKGEALIEMRMEGVLALCADTPRLLGAHSTYMALLCQAFAEGAVVNTLRRLGMEVPPLGPSDFHTFQDFLDGVQGSPPQKRL